MAAPKVLLALHDIQDLGGIINWVEHLCHGMALHGAEFKLVRLENKYEVRYRGFSSPTLMGFSGLKYNQRDGWNFPVKNKVPLKITNWKKYTDEYDLVIWVVPVPSKKKLFKGWENLYDIKPSQVMVIHDGNLNKLYPHAYDVIPHMRGVVGVHDCAYQSMKDAVTDMGTTAKLIPNAQIITRMRDVSFKSRENTVFSAQTFKRWKRVDDLVRAVPYIEGNVILAGGGIEYHYMTGAKQKPEYKGIWKAAIADGLDYIGYVSMGRMDNYLSTSKLLVDPSWSKSYAQYGSHFNRTFVDSIINGCLPAGRDLLMDGNSFFDKDLYVTIPYNASPQEFAGKVNEALAMTDRQYTKKVRALQEQVRLHFDSVLVAKQYLDFA